MTAGWDDELAALRELYLREAVPRLDTLDLTLDALAHRPDDRRALADLRRGFHSLAGSGATYGLQEVSLLGVEGERRLSDVGSSAPVAADLAFWRRVVSDLRRAFAAAGTQAPPLPAAPPAAAPAPPTLALVGFEAGEAESAARGLEQDGFAVRVLPRAAEAEAVLASALPDAVVVDLGPEPRPGFALVEGLRLRPGAERTVMLVVGDKEGMLDRVEAIHCGADGQMAKPVDPALLGRRVRFLMERDRAEPARILSLEDDPGQAAFLRTVLSSAGYEFRLIDDPARLETELASFRPDLLLMDLLLPGVSGHDLVRALRQEERYATLPVVVLTSHGETDDRIEVARSGGDEHLVKPVAPALLLSTVAARLERARLVRALLERDGLTGLLTHTALLERARQAVALKRRRPDRHWAWLMVDLDRFQAVNERHGHPTGDKVLVRLAGLLRGRLRQADVIGRFGGEEFGVVLEDIAEEDALRLVDRLRAEFAAVEHRAREGEAFAVTFSAGVAALEDAETLASWVAAALAALDAAKKGGRNRVVLAGPRRPAGT